MCSRDLRYIHGPLRTPYCMDSHMAVPNIPANLLASHLFAPSSLLAPISRVPPPLLKLYSTSDIATLLPETSSPLSPLTPTIEPAAALNGLGGGACRVVYQE